MIPLRVGRIDGFSRQFRGVRLFTSFEGDNPGGSIKDHMVLRELRERLRSGEVSTGDIVSEVSAGSTARSLAFHCRTLGLRCHLFLPSDAPSSLIQVLQNLGAETHIHERSVIYAAHQQFMNIYGGFYLNQLGREDLSRHYIPLGEALRGTLGNVDVLIGSVGTGHSLKGVAQGLRPTRTVVAEPPPGINVAGVRNLEYQRYGPSDCCLPAHFPHRVIVTPEKARQYSAFVEPWIASSTDSFHLVIAAAASVASTADGPLRIFALGAGNSVLSMSAAS